MLIPVWLLEKQGSLKSCQLYYRWEESVHSPPQLTSPLDDTGQSATPKWSLCGRPKREVLLNKGPTKSYPDLQSFPPAGRPPGDRCQPTNQTTVGCPLMDKQLGITTVPGAVHTAIGHCPRHWCGNATWHLWSQTVGIQESWQWPNLGLTHCGSNRVGCPETDPLILFGSIRC